MIGTVLSLAAIVPAALAARATSAALGLIGRGTPDPSEVDQLGAECDRLRAERDAARAKVERLTQERDRLKALASDLIDDLQSSNEEGPWRCEHCRVRLATIDDDGNGNECCDECAPVTEEVMKPTHYADAWRALIKAVRS